MGGLEADGGREISTLAKEHCRSSKVSSCRQQGGMRNSGNPTTLILYFL